LLRNKPAHGEIEWLREQGTTESGRSLAAIIRAFPEFFSARRRRPASCASTETQSFWPDPRWPPWDYPARYSRYPA